MLKYQKIVVTGFLLKDEKVLLIKRKKEEKFLPEYFEMPGGKVDFGEDPKESLRREFKEEVGLDIRVEKPYRTFSYESENSARHTVEIVYVTCLQDTREEKVDIVLGKDHTKYIWVKKDTLEPLLISREMKKSIECGFEEEGKYNKLKESLEKDILH
ncbi:MAG: NUDIX hydrolase [Candidatus Pacebacteria bacterium]|nr:NUDIX hydrolase [Candidatus Paceibacterota bacterium]